jgi:hypothetical protein
MRVVDKRRTNGRIKFHSRQQQCALGLRSRGRLHVCGSGASRERENVAESLADRLPGRRDAGIAWPARLTPEAVDAAGTDCRSRPAEDGLSHCIFDIFCLGRLAKEESYSPNRQSFDGFASFIGNNPFLEEDFENMLAVQKRHVVSRLGRRQNEPRTGNSNLQLPSCGARIH